jgi:hypothetical protein
MNISFFQNMIPLPRFPVPVICALLPIQKFTVIWILFITTTRKSTQKRLYQIRCYQHGQETRKSMAGSPGSRPFLFYSHPCFSFCKNPSFSSCNTILGWLFFPRDITRWRFILYFLFCWKLLRSISEIAAQRFKFPAHHF